MSRISKALSVVVALVATLISPIIQVPADSATASGSQFRSTYGNEFWVTFDTNYQNPPSAAKIFLASVATASVTVTWADQTTESITVSASSVATVDALPKWRANTQSDAVARTGIKISSDVAISVYLLNNEPATTDASIAYPTPYLGTRYRAVMAPNSLNTLENSYPSRFSVLATTDSTTVTVSPNTSFGSRTTASYQVTLNAGEVYTAASANDIIGTLIESDKPVQVSGSNGCANLGRGACDHIVEFMTPTLTWGKNYIVSGAPNTNAVGDRYLVMADQDSTVVEINGNPVTLAKGGDFHLFTGSTDDAAGRGEVISASKPVLVMQFIDYGRYGPSSQTGDPAMVVIPSVEQYLNDAIFTTPATGFTENSVTVIAKTAEIGQVTLDGTAIPSASFSPITNSTYSSARVFISLGTHRVKSTTGIGVFSYGYNPADSYAYSAGSGLVDLIANPGGVASVGYVTVENIAQGNLVSSPVVSASTPSGPLQKSPLVFSEIQPAISYPGAVVRIRGEHLNDINSMQIDGAQVDILSKSFGELVFRVPRNASRGLKTLDFGTNWGLHGWSYPLNVLEKNPRSVTFMFGSLSEVAQNEVSKLAKAIHLNHDKVRCISNSPIPQARKITEKICKSLTSEIKPTLPGILEPRTSYQGGSIWIRIFLGYSQ